MQKTLSLVLFLFFAATVAPCQSGQKQDGTPQPYVAQKPSRLARAFHTDSAWSGGDGAYSISLGKDRTLWIFGDSFIGTISGGRRLNNVMIHNAIALQDQKSGKMSFYWAKQSQPASYFADKDSYWLWPGDGIFYNDRVYCFARQVAQVQGKENDPFGFVWKQDELAIIANPSDDPQNWQVRHLPLAFTDTQIHLGCACWHDNNWLYVLGIKESTRQAILARISLSKLSNLELKYFEFLSAEKNNKATWSKNASEASPLFDHAATEGSLYKTRNGYACLYSRKGMGREIVLRTAGQLEGPWSPEEVVYKIPAATARRGFCYAAKAHTEQAAPSGCLAVTYAINPGDLASHVRDPQAYFPQVVYLKISDK